MEVLTGEVVDVIDIHNEFKTYEEFKESLDEDFWQAEERFVIIGYKLKAARDTDILRESGYRNVNEFAKAEYGLDKSQVSRFTRINDRFSVNGYSKRLDERYRGFGHSKLAIMLTLPAEINEELSSSYSRAEIQAIREEVDEERKITDLEVMLEEKDRRQHDHSALGRVLYQIGKDDPGLYLEIHDVVWNTKYEGAIRPVVEKLMDVLAPAGEATISVRIAREGRKMLIIRGADIDPVLVGVRSGEKQAYTWEQLIDEVKTACQDAEDGRNAWKILYGELFPEKKAEVAPVQPQKEQGSRKVSKVIKAKKPEKTPAETVRENTREASGQREKEEQEAAGSENEESRAQTEACADNGQAGEPAACSEPADEEDGAGGGAGEDSAGGGADGEDGAGAAKVQPGDGELEGQMDITQYPGYMPETYDGRQEKPSVAAGDTKGQEKPGMTRTEAEPAEAAGVEDSGGKIINPDGMRRHIENQKQIISDAISLMSTYCDKGIWDGLIEEANAVITRAESIKNMEEMWHG